MPEKTEKEVLVNVGPKVHKNQKKEALINRMKEGQKSMSTAKTRNLCYDDIKLDRAGKRLIFSSTLKTPKQEA